MSMAWKPLEARAPDVGYGRSKQLDVATNSQTPPPGDISRRHRFFIGTRDNDNWHAMRIAVKRAEEAPRDENLRAAAIQAIDGFFLDLERTKTTYVKGLRTGEEVAVARRSLYYLENTFHLGFVQQCTILISALQSIHAMIQTLPANLDNPIQARLSRLAVAIMPLVAFLLDRILMVPKKHIILMYIFGAVACSILTDFSLWYFTLPEKELLEMKNLPKNTRKYGT